MAHVLLTTKQVASILAIDERSVRNYVERGQLPAKRLSQRALRYNSAAVAKYAGLNHADVLAAIDKVPEKNKEGTL